VFYGLKTVGIEYFCLSVQKADTFIIKIYSKPRFLDHL